jgi:serine/threonine protein kinase
LEYLHSLDMCCWLKAENIMLDALGHITPCGFGLFRQRDGMHPNWKRPEYPAPEVLMNDKEGKAAHWWTLGVDLYEMLTGLPPFYSNVLGNIRDNTISKTLHLTRPMHCGRIFELAMDLRFVEMVQLLLEYGADIGLTSPVWGAPRHECWLVPKSVYQRVTAVLQEIQSNSLEE